MIPTPPPHAAEIADVVARLEALRALDAPTHGGRLLSYVYDSGVPSSTSWRRPRSAPCSRSTGSIPTTFRSVAVIERELVDFARAVFHADDEVVGTATSGGTESCLLAVKTAREAWRARGGRGCRGSSPRPRCTPPSARPRHSSTSSSTSCRSIPARVVPTRPRSPVASGPTSPSSS